MNQQSYSLTTKLRQFKLSILERLIIGKITIALTPTFINHRVNELEEYLRILTSLLEGKQVRQFDALHHDFLWLLDATGHAAAITSDLDFVEKRLIVQSKDFELFPFTFRQNYSSEWLIIPIWINVTNSKLRPREIDHSSWIYVLSSIYFNPPHPR